MRTNQKVAGIRTLLATVVMSLLCVGTVQAQADLPVCRGKFNLPYEVHWGKSVLQPGAYTLTIQSLGIPNIASISKADGSGGILVVARVHGDPKRGVNALLVSDKDGQLTVHSLSLENLKMVLIYDPSLARESVQQARVSRTVPVVWAKQ
jgi:hypothetical protein